MAIYSHQQITVTLRLGWERRAGMAGEQKRRKTLFLIIIIVITSHKNTEAIVWHSKC